MGDDLLHPLTPPVVTGSRLVILAGLAGFALLVLALAGGRRASAAPAAPVVARQVGGGGLDADQVTAGRSLYVTHCSSCHGIQAEGTRNGPSLVHAGAASADFYLRTGRMPLNDPSQQAARHRPAFPPDQISALVAYVASLDAGPAIPTVLPGNLANGNELFSINCAQCHNDAGAGGALGYGDIVPSLRNSSSIDVVEAARIGPKPMPVFNPQTLSDQQVSDIATYVQYLHHPEDRGGLGLGHLGPIPEGFVGWVVGMGALLLVCRLIGTRG
ncbi:MAG: ubiquinol-cytochrome c reductase cytochrome c subunit [Acidimicrobiaceae bacterium]|jgi:ubiquinol-cytochrome c reductase cytochrome c subunit|nr:ubiquinol-cytochrome c reductase cytochrome c subunit [Acidimicrobiaceae bacterium]MDQ1401656.1 ubiquinol-cytochrome c reductase cytochrome c subunit [Acidimicrobiaceae bacterium]MDQ1413009.1 ubiquinol-cytochrome c reductase cytochrome c subunit [Acidimicrobiaceae bacterium]MDQ1415359.1 ubiquinol-cytochrome c reductase cytochrome c subunit [Acidimicrobiaceae bacterium]